MQSTLIVKRFGPIEDINMDLRSVNIFIGPQASGKSALAKLYVICKSPLSFLEKTNHLAPSIEESNDFFYINFIRTLEEYNIHNFLRDDTYIEFNSDLHKITYENKRIKYERKCLNKINELIKLSKNNIGNPEINTILQSLTETFFHFWVFFNSQFFNKEDQKNTTTIHDRIEKYKFNEKELDEVISFVLKLENDLSANPALYVPAERNLISIIKGASLSLLNNNVPIPKHILNFGAEYEKASYDKPELDLNFIRQDLKYKNENGTDLIYIGEKTAIKLTESASGLQSVIPLLLPIVSRREKNKFNHLSFVIEEPELNLFPEAQYELVKFLEKGRMHFWMRSVADIGVFHTYTTHSPYILSAFNNLLYAGVIREKMVSKWEKENYNIKYPDSLFKDLEKIIPTYIESDSFSAYQIVDGKATPILDRDVSLIRNNFIDDASEKMAEDFESLMQLMSSYD